MIQKPLLATKSLFSKEDGVRSITTRDELTPVPLGRSMWSIDNKIITNSNGYTVPTKLIKDRLLSNSHWNIHDECLPMYSNADELSTNTVGGRNYVISNHMHSCYVMYRLIKYMGESIKRNNIHSERWSKFKVKDILRLVNLPRLPLSSDAVAFFAESFMIPCTHASHNWLLIHQNMFWDVIIDLIRLQIDRRVSRKHAIKLMDVCWLFIKHETNSRLLNRNIDLTQFDFVACLNDEDELEVGDLDPVMTKPLPVCKSTVSIFPVQNYKRVSERHQ